MIADLVNEAGYEPRVNGTQCLNKWKSMKKDWKKLSEGRTNYLAKNAKFFETYEDVSSSLENSEQFCSSLKRRKLSPSSRESMYLKSTV